jgi:hypothetical protein
VKAQNFKEQVWIGGSIIIGSLVIFGVAFYVLAGDIQHAADDITKNRNLIANQSMLINSFSSLKANAAAAAVYQAAMDKVLSTQDNLIIFPTQIDGIARKDDVDVTFSFEGDPVPAVATKVGYVNFSLSATGPLSNITAFVTDMESSAQILLSKIDSFDVAQSGSGYVLSANGEVFFK